MALGSVRCERNQMNLMGAYIECQLDPAGHSRSIVSMYAVVT